MVKYRRLDDMDFNGKKVIVRVDFNVPLDKNGVVSDNKRIVSALPTIRYLLDHNAAQIILMSHLGKPKSYDQKFSLKPAAIELERLIDEKVKMMDDCIDIEIPESPRIIMLENLRFHPEEKKNDSEFARKLASYADIYVNDAFGTCHRAHASVDAITEYIPACAGLLVQKEIDIIDKALSYPKKPFIAIMGGIKVSDKINVIENLLKKVDKLLIGGAMMYTFLKAQGKNTGKSLVEEDKVDLARNLLRNEKIKIPVDAVVGKEMKEDTDFRIVSVDNIDDNDIGLDIGPETVKKYSQIIKNAKTIIWNGPMGKFEWKNFSHGSYGIAKAIAESDAISIIGGGDSAAAISKLGFENKVTHVSTGGGASLRLLEGNELPALSALERNMRKFPNL